MLAQKPNTTHTVLPRLPLRELHGILSQRMVKVLQHIHGRHPGLLQPRFPKVRNLLQNLRVHRSGTRRKVVKEESAEVLRVHRQKLVL